MGDYIRVDVSIEDIIEALQLTQRDGDISLDQCIQINHIEYTLQEALDAHHANVAPTDVRGIEVLGPDVSETLVPPVPDWFGSLRHWVQG